MRFTHLLLSIAVATFSFSAFGQGTWKQLDDHPGPDHFTATSFQVGDHVYHVVGYTSSGNCAKELWRFDPANNAWKQMSSFPGDLHGADPVSFSIDSIGYVATGNGCSTGLQASLWAYDPSSDSWSQKADYPAGGREMAIGFSIGGKGYVGLGRTSSSSFNSDLYAYDPSTNTWTSKASYPGSGKANSVALTYDSSAYVLGGGSNSTSGGDKLWRYEPKYDAWTHISDLPGQGRRNHSGFSIAQYLYFGGGWTGGSVYSDFYRYNVETNQWKQIPDKPAPALRNMEGFSFDGKGYVVGGKDDGGSFQSDVFVYTSPFVGQKEFEETEASFHVYPNPVEERLYFGAEELKADPVRARVLSLEGKTLKEVRIDRSESGMNVKGLSSGLYFLEIEGENGSTRREKFLVR